MHKHRSIIGAHPPRARRAKAATPLVSHYDRAIITAAQLDRLADAELQHGHHVVAELLARRAAELREAGR